MSSRAERIESRLLERLGEVGRALGVPVDAHSAASALVDVVDHVRREGGRSEAWLLWTALAGCFPIGDEALELHRDLEHAADGEHGARLALARTRHAAGRRGRWAGGYRIQVGGLVADVDFCARNEHNTGIQRLVRETVSRWRSRGVEVTYAAWDFPGSVMRELEPAERARVLAWADPERDRSELPEVVAPEIVVPWRAQVVLLEVPRPQLCPSLVGLARWSGNRVDVIGYDAIPLVSADLVSHAESERFAWYLAAVKYANSVLAISEAAAEEFAGFADAVRVQGLPGPEVRAVPLPVDVPVRGAARAVADPPYLLCVGSHDPRKNHEAIIEAARILGREGLRPRIVFVGRGSAGAMRRLAADAEAARVDGVEIVMPSGVDDAELARLYAGARATLFPSLHEGFGLPVAESLAYGAPALTSDFGSMAEVAAGGGCVLVDPRDLGALADGMRSLLTDDELIARLEGEIERRPHRTWDDYADDLADALGVTG